MRDGVYRNKLAEGEDGHHAMLMKIMYHVVIK